MDWLLASIDSSRAHEVSQIVSWHGRLMVLAWGIGAPLAVFIARYLKVLPGQDWPRDLDSQVWWRSHWMGQMGVVGVTLIGVALVLMSKGPEAGLHRAFGLAVVAFALGQVLFGLFRGTKGGPTAVDADGSLRGDHYDMTPWRRMFEAVHKGCGYLVLMLGAVTVLQGMWLANAPRWMWLVVLAWWGMLLLGAVLLQRLGWAVDTYQAIWGPDPSHPGNQLKSQGWGMRRYEEEREQ